jgi:predicted RNA-binding protein associated with RNAse of E/G family
MADDGFAWLHVLPEGKNWCLTAMFNDRGEPVQYYFDITSENTLDGENSRFIDLYLDIVCLPDGKTEIIDQLDLDEALANAVIVQEQYDLAQRTAEVLQPQITARFAELTAFCIALYNELNA